LFKTLTLRAPGPLPSQPALLRHWQLVLKYFRYEPVLEYSLSTRTSILE